MEKERGEPVNTIQNRGYRSRGRARAGQRRPQRGTARSNSHTPPIQPNSVKCINCGGNFPHKFSCPAKGQKCYYCQKLNHFETVCRQKRTKERVREVHEGACGGQSESSNDEYCYSVRRESEKTPKSTVLINNKPVKLLVDTGASVNILDEAAYKSVGTPKLTRRHLPKLLPYGGGNALEIKGKCELLVEKNC